MDTARLPAYRSSYLLRFHPYPRTKLSARERVVVRCLSLAVCCWEILIANPRGIGLNLGGRLPPTASREPVAFSELLIYNVAEL